MEWWSDYGFDAEPDTRVSDGTVLVYRAYGGMSNQYGDYVIVPRMPGLLQSRMTADELEMELNIALWGNTIERISEFRILPCVGYIVGPIRQSGLINREHWISFFRNDRKFEQGLIPGGNARSKLQLLHDYPVRRGRLVTTSTATH